MVGSLAGNQLVTRASVPRADHDPAPSWKAMRISAAAWFPKSNVTFAKSLHWLANAATLCLSDADPLRKRTLSLRPFAHFLPVIRARAGPRLAWATPVGMRKLP